MNKRSCPASHRGRSLLLTVLKFQVLLKESLFLRLIVPYSAPPAAHKQTMCVCVGAHTWIFPTQNAANHVCTSQREGGRERKKSDKVLDRKREEEVVRRRKKRFPYSAAVAIATRPTIHTASATVAWRLRELTLLLFPNTLAMSNHIVLHPRFCFQPGHSTWERKEIPSRV